MAGEKESGADVGAPCHKKVEFGTLKRLEFRARGHCAGRGYGAADTLRYGDGDGAFQEGHHDLR